VVNLKGEVRLSELASMFGEVSEGTMQSARELMNSVRALTTNA
jgi:hypothetical protein